MKVADFMTRKDVTVTPETSILAAARLMLDHKISGLPRRLRSKRLGA